MRKIDLAVRTQQSLFLAIVSTKVTPRFDFNTLVAQSQEKKYKKIKKILDNAIKCVTI